ncbi:hypothetical protein ACLB2K_033631 [Fragaria x ananassa]
MEKNDNNMTRSGDLLKLSIKYSKVEWKLQINEQKDDLESEVKRMKLRFLRSDELDHRQKKLKAMITLIFDRFLHVLNANEGTTLCLCMRSLDAAAYDKWYEDDQSTRKFFFEQAQLKNTYVLVDLAQTQLKSIKAYNSKTLALLEAGNLDEVALHEMSNFYSSFYKGIYSLRLKIGILEFHLMKPPQRRPETSLVDRYSAWVEDELRQYEEELKTTKFIVFQVMKNKFGGLRWFGLRLLPRESCKTWVLFLNMFFQKTYKPIPLAYNLVLVMLWRHPENVKLDEVNVVRYCAAVSRHGFIFK